MIFNVEKNIGPSEKFITIFEKKEMENLYPELFYWKEGDER